MFNPAPLRTAIRTAIINACPSLGQRVYSEVAADGTPRPHARITIPDDSPVMRALDGGTGNEVDGVLVQLSVFHTDAATAESLAVTIAGVFHRKTLALTGTQKVLCGIKRGYRLIKETREDKSIVYNASVDVEFLVQH